MAAGARSLGRCAHRVELTRPLCRETLVLGPALLESKQRREGNLLVAGSREPLRHKIAVADQPHHMLAGKPEPIGRLLRGEQLLLLSERHGRSASTSPSASSSRRRSVDETSAMIGYGRSSCYRMCRPLLDRLQRPAGSSAASTSASMRTGSMLVEQPRQAQRWTWPSKPTLMALTADPRDAYPGINLLTLLTRRDG